MCSYLTEAEVYLAGPLASLAGAAVAVFGADAEKMNVAFYFCVLSLGLGCFNLLPLPGLDGAGALRSLLLYLMPDMYAAERAARVAEAVLAVLFWLAAGAVWLAFDTGAYPLALSVFFLLRLLCG
jgi:Zn-dependent protease